MPMRAPTTPGVPTDQVSSLTGAIEDLAGQFALPALLERILRRAVGLLDGAAGSICTVDERAGTYRKEADLGVGCRQGQVFSLAEGTTGAVVARRGPVVFERYSDVPGGHVAEEDRGRLLATVGVPIEWAGAIIGACVIFSTDPARRWRQNDLDLLRVFAGHAAVAITNSRLHAEAADGWRSPPSASAWCATYTMRSSAPSAPWSPTSMPSRRHPRARTGPTWRRPGRRR